MKRLERARAGLSRLRNRRVATDLNAFKSASGACLEAALAAVKTICAASFERVQKSSLLRPGSIGRTEQASTGTITSFRQPLGEVPMSGA
jgi:hypothetical protein